MKLLVGIPTHKRPELLRKCLDSIAAQRGALPEIEVFIADNDAAGREGVNLVEQMAPGFPYPLAGAVVAQPGISAVRNAILDEAKRRGVDFIAMIDDDETASPEWLVNLLKSKGRRQPTSSADMSILSSAVRRRRKSNSRDRSGRVRERKGQHTR